MLTATPCRFKDGSIKLTDRINTDETRNSEDRLKSLKISRRELKDDFGKLDPRRKSLIFDMLIERAMIEKD